MVAIPDQLKQKRYLVLIGAVLALLAALIVGSRSPVAALSQVEVQGMEGKQAEKVRQAANVQHGVPLVDINENEVAARVQDVANVASVQVSRSWPNTLVIKVVQRKPVAKVELGYQEWEIVDSTGLAYRTTKKQPNLPTLQASVEPPFTGRGRVEGAKILSQLPDWLAKRIVTVKADNPQKVVLVTKDNENIIWGTAEDSELKSQVLRVLLKEPGMFWFDVRNPNLPTASQYEPRPAPKPKEKKDKDEATESSSASPSASESADESATLAPDDSSVVTPASPAAGESRKPGEPYLLP